MSAPPRLKGIREAYEKLHGALESKAGWGRRNVAETLLGQCQAEEREHRGFLPAFARHHAPSTPGVLDMARLFAVKRVAEYLRGESFPVGKDYLHCQRSCFIAAGIVDEYRAEVLAAWAGLDLEALAALDYRDFVVVANAGEL